MSEIFGDNKERGEGLGICAGEGLRDCGLSVGE